MYIFIDWDSVYVGVENCLSVGLYPWLTMLHKIQTGYTHVGMTQCVELGYMYIVTPFITRHYHSNLVVSGSNIGLLWVGNECLSFQ